MRSIIIDCDPGQDDAIAILMALGSEDLSVAGITAVMGNADVEHTARNARIVCALAGRHDIPIYAGAHRPLIRALHRTNFHGVSGLDGLDLSTLPQAAGQPDDGTHAVDFLIRAIRRAPERSISLCALGPLTNIALALLQAPDLARRLREIVIMGGAYSEHGNTTPAAEFNMQADPEAAAIVFSSEARITVVPLDVTHQALFTVQHVDELRRSGGRCRQAAAGWLHFCIQQFNRKYGREVMPIHDACVIGYVLAPALFGGKEVNIVIETLGEFTAGMTVVDWRGVSGRRPNATFLHDIDATRFTGLLMSALARLP